MNAYEKRLAERNAKHAATRKANREIRKMEVDAIMRRYETAYFDYYGRKVTVKYSNGWFTVHHRKVRQERFMTMIQNLEVILNKMESADDL